MGDQWPWKAGELDPHEPYNGRWYLYYCSLASQNLYWKKLPFVAGRKVQHLCWKPIIPRPKILQFNPLRLNGCDPKITLSQTATLFQLFPSLRDLGQCWCSHQMSGPRGLYWICEEMTYTILPQEWSGLCVLGAIHPSFSLFPLARGQLWKSKCMRTGRLKGNTVPYRLAIRKMINGFLSI